MSRRPLDWPRIGIASVVAAGLGFGLAVAFLRRAESTSHVGPTSATLDEALSLLLGAMIGLGLGGAAGALLVRRGPRVRSGVLVGVLAYVVVLAPLFVITDDVGLDEDLSPGGLLFLASVAAPLAASAFVGATVGDLLARIRSRA